MSSVYISEPPTNGKVVISTTCGDIDIELWSRECPLACKNFISHCLNGYYDKNIFHRVIKDFMIQTGDPTGTGTGGQSIWGKPFKDEFHQRIKFNHRGLVAMANSQKAHSNESQWFVTLKAAEWLDKKHTIFGKVTGNTIFNVLRIGEVEVEDDRPLDDVSIVSCEVLNNPFPEIVANEDANKVVKVIEKTEKKSVKKDNKLLSFGDDNDSDEEDNDAKEMMQRLAQKKRAKQEKDRLEEEVRLAKETEKRKEKEAMEIASAEEVTTVKAARDNESRIKKEGSTVATTISDTTKFSSSTKAVPKAAASTKKEVVQNRSYVEEMRAEYFKNKGKEKDGGKKSEKKRQSDTLAKLSAFTSKIKKQKIAAKKQGLSEAPKTENYHGQVMESKDDEEVDINSWHVGKLVFRRHIDDNYRNVNDVNNYVTIDGSGESNKDGKEKK